MRICKLELQNFRGIQQGSIVLPQHVDFGDDWWHQINVVAIEGEASAGKYPKVVKRTGKSPRSMSMEPRKDEITAQKTVSLPRPVRTRVVFSFATVLKFDSPAYRFTGSRYISRAESRPQRLKLAAEIRPCVHYSYLFTFDERFPEMNTARRGDGV